MKTHIIAHPHCEAPLNVFKSQIVFVEVRKKLFTKNLIQGTTDSTLHAKATIRKKYLIS